MRRELCPIVRIKKIFDREDFREVLVMTLMTQKELLFFERLKSPQNHQERFVDNLQAIYRLKENLQTTGRRIIDFNKTRDNLEAKRAQDSALTAI